MSIQNEFSSFKLLLKQVYSAHTTKIKELENEIKTLKEKLAEKERETKSNSPECKRCIELEEAFKSCKKALHDQSKLFENFGQKFSIFSSPELGNQEVKSIPKPSNSISETEKFSRTLKNNTFCDRNESIISLEESIVIKSNVNNGDNITSVSNNQNLLKKLMCDDGLETFDAYTVTFPENVNRENINIKSDSLILVPDSLDCSLVTTKECENLPKEENSKQHKNNSPVAMKECENLLKEENTNQHKNNSLVAVKECGNLPKEENAKRYKHKKISNAESENLKVKKNYPDTKVPCKRLSDTVNDQRAKRFNNGNQVESSSKIITRTEDAKACDLSGQKAIVSNEISKEVQVPKIVTSNEVSKQAEVKTKTTLKDSKAQNGQVSKKKIISAEPTESKKNKNEASKNSVNNVTYDFKNKFTRHETSPSLLPTNAKAPPKTFGIESTASDNDDFEVLASNGKLVQNEDSLDGCDKKKFAKKSKVLKSIKSTSKFKITLDAPSSNYKKPSFKQTKLSKSIFRAKEVSSNKKSPIHKQNEEEFDLEVIEDNSFPAILQDHFQTSTQCTAAKTVDIDATFIPEDFKFEISPCVTSSVKKNAVEKSTFKKGGLFSNISFPEEENMSEKVNENEINDHSSSEDTELKENRNSFDRVPVPEEPNYKYKNDVVRKKADKKQLNGFDCKECEKYYSELGLTGKEKKERMKKCSRHRGKFTPPTTPDHFWELDFPDTQECKARGYMNETQKVRLTNIYNI